MTALFTTSTLLLLFPCSKSHLPKLTYKEVMETEEGLWR